MSFCNTPLRVSSRTAKHIRVLLLPFGPARQNIFIPFCFIAILRPMRRVAIATATIAMLVGLPAADPAPKPPKADPKTAAERKAAQSILKSLSLRDRVAQMVIGITYGDVPSVQSVEYRQYLHWTKD